MRRWRYQTSKNENRDFTVVGGQIVAIGVVAHATEGSWLQIGNNRGIWIPAGMTFSLSARDLGALIDADPDTMSNCDKYPGDGAQIEIRAGINARPKDQLEAGGAPQSVFIATVGSS